MTVVDLWEGKALVMIYSYLGNGVERRWKKKIRTKLKENLAGEMMVVQALKSHFSLSLNFHAI